MSRPHSLAILGVSAIAIFATHAVVATADPREETPGESGTHASLSIAISSSDNGVVLPNRDVTITYAVTNTTSEPVAASTIDVRLTSGTLATQDDVDEWIRGASSTRSTPIASGPGAIIPPGGTLGPTTLVVPASEFPQQVTRTAVYGLSASVVEPRDEVAQTSRTVITAYPATETPRAPITVIAPLVTPSQTKGLISAPDLEAYTSPGGLLAKQLDALSSNPPIAIGIDPMIIASIRVLGDAAPQSAIGWLNRLSAVQNETFALSYADSDIAAQAQSGLTTLAAPISFDHIVDGSAMRIPDPKSPAPPSPLDPSVSTADTIKRLLQWNYTRTGVGLPRDNTVTESTMDVFRASGIATTVLSNGNVRAPDDATALGGAATIGGASVLVSNAALSGAIREAVAAESPAPWQARIATVNAHVSLLAAKDPARPIAVVLDRAGAATNNCLSETLASLAASPSIAPAMLDNALNARPAINYTIVDSQENEKRLSSVRALFGDEAQAQMFATAIDKPVLITGSQRLSLLALLANSWADSPDWSDRVDTQRTTTAKLVQSVEIVPASTVNLVNREGSIPVTVRNRSVYPVTISVMATPSNSRLEVDNPRFQPTRIDKDTQDQALVPVKAQLGNGEVTLRLALLSPTMTPIGAAVSVPINVRAEWETVGAVVVGAFVVVFFGFGVTRNIRKRRRLRSTRSPSGTAREVTD